MPRPGAPALLLVHGFGAFGDQWRGNMAALAAAGYSVYAPTLPGFGRSEKAALTYSQECWRDYIRWVGPQQQIRGWGGVSGLEGWLSQSRVGFGDQDGVPCSSTTAFNALTAASSCTA
jgi:pimeloyl-ACP methyl ester carboxylesterase